MPCRKYNYSYGDNIGDYGIIYLKELPPTFSVSKKGIKHTYRMCEVECPVCHKPFEAREENVRRGLTKRCAQCGHKRGGETNKIKYKPFEQIGPDKNVVFIKEISPKNIYTYKNIDNIIRRGIFYNIKTHQYFESDIRSVKIGHSSGTGKSLGERLVQQSLDELGIKYKTQFTFNDLKSPETGAFLRFDFYLPDNNCCIEYDGQQHFYPVSWFKKTELDYQKIVRYDELKNIYCMNHKIKLIRIPYTELQKINSSYLNNLLSAKNKE